MAEREPTQRNDAASWSDWDADGYWKNNYASVLPEDAQIIRRASDFLIKARGGRPPVTAALDVGAGTNLYPALLMLPWTEHIVFTEYAPDNIAWLAENLADGPGEWKWQPFWDLMAPLPGYAGVGSPRRRLAAHHEVRHVSIFDLPRRAWDLGSMFFVADGMTSDEAEFEDGVRAFLRALTPAAPFMMAFMEGSAGYDVSGIRFPGVTITPGSLAALLARLPVTSTEILRTDKTTRPLRNGYEAMLLVTGYVTASPPGAPGYR
jgi:hypothetical protein